jgi:hypothetical protein
MFVTFFATSLWLVAPNKAYSQSLADVTNLINAAKDNYAENLAQIERDFDEQIRINTLINNNLVELGLNGPALREFSDEASKDAYAQKQADGQSAKDAYIQTLSDIYDFTGPVPGNYDDEWSNGIGVTGTW